MMNGYREDNSCCYFHPKQVVIGVCPLCLNERLLVLASKQGQRSSSSSSTRAGRSRFLQGVSQKKPHIYLPNIFAFGSLLNRPQPHLNHLKPQDFDDHDASTSQEDSFISIKFEENGVGSWEKGKVSKVSLEHCSMSWKASLSNKSVIEHPKPGGSLRWRKRMGHLFQLVRWKRSNKAEGVKVMKKSWITRTLTKKTKE
ncbi:hypothetical protein CXB51_011334 [Gossypium anomalum]|uniref:Uncharacterized protein n=9 Tax=Gossypium TaxID=3633 RepID=A0A8J5Z8L2_9ROSI|nr:uncharacterized protein LOC105770613 [Gossypium raimondii]KAA3453803.1 putative serine/threonine-protein kinase [Gossypium australe]KAB2030633.1 hypothetical protein ES319_D05G246900v1 [Gossypium barbadense]KAG8493891.1 hypothetical protein CXB51_011334 [Gossypium anomalum]TYG69791.1 hypothetical protein ES288_D05G259400v1 [Gossypium darwinii]TYH72489.1 hypothetical protein ES332_D05G258500v1 [Gossypium tomentosum]TYI82871.1 hypothetical protein E1A91_D05G251700v1 [Gossypium mustelinum]